MFLPAGEAWAWAMKQGTMYALVLAGPLRHYLLLNAWRGCGHDALMAGALSSSAMLPGGGSTGVQAALCLPRLVLLAAAARRLPRDWDLLAPFSAVGTGFAQAARHAFASWRSCWTTLYYSLYHRRYGVAYQISV